MAAYKTFGEMTKDYLKNTFFKSQEFHDLVFDNAKYILEGRFEVKSEPKYIWLVQIMTDKGWRYSIFSSKDKAINTLRNKYLKEADNHYCKAFNYNMETVEMDTTVVSWNIGGILGITATEKYFIQKMQLDKLTEAIEE